MKKYVITGLVVIVALVAALAGGMFEKEEQNTETISIGAVVSLTGFAASFGEMSKQGIDLAVKEINADGGIEGRMVEVVFEDDQTDPKIAAGLYQKMTGTHGVSAIIGSNFDFVTQPLFALAETGSAIVVSPSNPRIPGAFDTNAGSFVMMSDFSRIIAALDGVLGEDSYKQFGVVRFDSAFSEEIVRNVEGMLATHGKSPVVVETYKQLGGNDFRTTILKLQESGVDMVFLDMIGTDTGVFLKQAKELGYAPRMIAHVGLVDSLRSEQFEPSLFEGVTVLDWNESPAGFREKFEAEYGVQPTNSANRAYDAVKVLATAIAEVGDDREAIVQYLETHTVETPNGDFQFTAEHAAESTPVAIRVVRGGELVSSQ
jgi:branched-chain amino acid transport system substrate-binding protein